MIFGFLDTGGRGDDDGVRDGAPWWRSGPLLALLVWAMAFAVFALTFVVPQCVTRMQPGYDLPATGDGELPDDAPGR